MIEELGKWLLDIAKYIVTAYVLVRMFGNDDGSIWTLIGAVFLQLLRLGQGYILSDEVKIKIRKVNNMDYGLLGMYLFLSVIAIGSLVYVKIEDHKEQKQ